MHQLVIGKRGSNRPPWGDYPLGHQMICESQTSQRLGRRIVIALESWIDFTRRFSDHQLNA